MVSISAYNFHHLPSVFEFSVPYFPRPTLIMDRVSFFSLLLAFLPVSFHTTIVQNRNFCPMFLKSVADIDSREKDPDDFMRLLFDLLGPRMGKGSCSFGIGSYP